MRRRRLRPWALAGLLTAVSMVGAFALAGGCIEGSGDRPAGAACSSDGECAGSLVCQYGRCRGECAFDRDCPDGGACIAAEIGPGRVCTTEQESGCSHEDPCEAPLVCGPDGICRDPCDGVVCDDWRDCIDGTCVERGEPSDGDADVDGDADADVDGGDGGSSMAIGDCSALAAMAGDLSGDYALDNDVDCSGVADFSPIGSSTNPFTGSLDGRGHSVSGLRLGDATEHRTGLGLFGVLGESAVVERLALVDAELLSSCTGGVLAEVNRGTVVDVMATGAITSTRSPSCVIGGLVAQNAGIIQTSYADVTVADSMAHAGGLVGDNSGIIRASFAAGALTLDPASTSASAGGMLRSMPSGELVHGLWVDHPGDDATECVDELGAAVSVCVGLGLELLGSLYDSGHPEYTSPEWPWDFTTTWQAHPDRLPTLRPRTE